jgi:hypothetical protein
LVEEQGGRKNCTGEGAILGQGNTSGTDGYIYYFDGADGFIGIYTCQNLLNYSLLNINDTPIKPLKSEKKSITMSNL